MCNGEVCPYSEKVKQWQKAIVEHDGSYPDPIDNSPCDRCIKSK